MLQAATLRRDTLHGSGQGRWSIVGPFPIRPRSGARFRGDGARGPQRSGSSTVQVTAFSTPAKPDWRWRIVNYAGEILEESREAFPTISAAVAKGTERLVEMNVVDHSLPSKHWRSTSHLRSR